MDLTSRMNINHCFMDLSEHPSISVFVDSLYWLSFNDQYNNEKYTLPRVFICPNGRSQMSICVSMNYVTVDETNKECPCVNCMWNVSKQNKLSNTVTAISWHCRTQQQAEKCMLIKYLLILTLSLVHDEGIGSWWWRRMAKHRLQRVKFQSYTCDMAFSVQLWYMVVEVEGGHLIKYTSWFSGSRWSRLFSLFLGNCLISYCFHAQHLSFLFL